MMFPFLSQLFAHTHLASTIDVLSYRKGSIEARIDLHPDDRVEFERRVEALKLQMGTAIRTAEEQYKKDLRALFIEFGQIMPEPPIVLQNVVQRNEDAVIGGALARS